MQYVIIDINDISEYKFLIIRISSDALLSEKNEIVLDLKLKNIEKGKVLLDTLLHSGNTDERFVEAYFDGEKFTSLKYIVIEKRHTIREKTCQILRNIPNSIEYSILSNTQKKLIQKGCYI